MPRIFYDQKSLHRSLTRLAFSFPTNGASSPASVTGRGVKSVVRTATGLYTVTLQDYWTALLHGKATLQLATPAKQKAQIKGAFNPATALTFVVGTFASDTGSAADVAAAANNRVNVLLLLQNGAP